METLLAWVWTPLVLYAVALGMGLLTERVVRVELPNALVPPLGLAAGIVVVTPVYRLGGDATLAAGIVAIAAVAGLLLARSSLRRRLNPGWAGGAAVTTYLVYLAPVLLTGHWTWGGYRFVNDTATNLLLADLLAHHGVRAPVVDSATTAIEAGGVNLGYPLGAHMLLATLGPLSGASLAALYQPVIAAAAGLGAMSLTEIARRSGLLAARAATTAVLALTAVLLYRYALHGSIKEVLLVSLLSGATGVGTVALDGRLEARVVVLVALCALPMVLVFSAAAAAHGLILGVFIFVIALLRADRPDARQVARIAAVGAGVAFLLALPSLGDTLSFARDAGNAFGSSGGDPSAQMGHLIRPLPAVEAVGVWLARDYRLPADYPLYNAVGIVAVLALGLVGILVEVRRRRPAGILLLAASGIPAAALAPRLGPYADAKLLVILSPAVVLIAAIGAWSLISQTRRTIRALGALATAAMIVGIFVSAVFAYHETRLAPRNRVAAMTDVARHADGGGLWLVNEWEEFAKYFMSRIRVNPAFESESPHPVELRRPQPIFGHYFDLDAERLSYVTRFAGVIKRRSPIASRPPASYELVYRNAYYEAWRRRPGIKVTAHLPLQSVHSASARPSCGAVRRLAVRARPGERLVGAWRPQVAMLDTARSSARPSDWVLDSDIAGVVDPNGAGRVTGRVRVAGGAYRAWVLASTGRAIGAYVDGRSIGKVKGVNSPDQWFELRPLRLSAGVHRLELRRAGPSLAPGDGYRGELGPLLLERLARPRLLGVVPTDFRRLCAEPWDWLERVRGLR